MRPFRQQPKKPNLEQFAGDDGSFAYARATGIYVDGIEAPVFPDRVVAPPRDRKPLVIMTFGQSNAANTGSGLYKAQRNVVIFNVFDMKFYQAADPLPGASNNG